MQVRERLSQNGSPQKILILVQGKGERRRMLLQVRRMEDVATGGLWTSDLLALTRVPCASLPPTERRHAGLGTLWSRQ